MKIDPNYPLNSHLAIYSNLAKLRQNEAILFGSLDFVNSTSESPELFGYSRVKKGNPGTLVRSFQIFHPVYDVKSFFLYIFTFIIFIKVLVNFGTTDASADLSEMKYIPERGTVLLRSVYNPDSRPDER